MFVRDLDVAGTAIGDWQPLAGAQLHSVYGNQLGARLQDSGQPSNAQRFLVSATAVPDGQPDQPDLYSLCPIVRGDVGAIVALEAYVRYEGDGRYGLQATASTGTTSGQGCANGPTSSGEYTVSAPTSIAITGTSLLNPIDDMFKQATVALSAPPGASRTDILCARDAVRQPDGSLTGSLTHTSSVNPGFPTDAGTFFPEPGFWTCVASSRYANSGPWSEPTPAMLVQADYLGMFKPYRLRDSVGPTYGYSAKAYPAAPGAKLVLTVAEVKSCTKAGRIILKRKGRRVVSAKVGAGGTTAFKFRLPNIPLYAPQRRYILSSTLIGAKFVRSETVQDIALLLDHQTGRRTRGALVLGVC
jgi:hypothetical protein